MPLTNFGPLLGLLHIPIEEGEGTNGIIRFSARLFFRARIWEKAQASPIEA